MTSVIENPVDSVTIRRFAELSGYSEKAVRRKIERGDWLEGFEYHRAPTGGVTIYLPGFNRWAQGLPRLSPVADV